MCTRLKTHSHQAESAVGQPVPTTGAAAQINPICVPGTTIDIEPMSAQNGGYLESSADNAW
jgi:hypothetical protein